MKKKESETRLVIWSALCIVAFGAVAIAAAQTSSTSPALCDGIAAQIQHNAASSPDDPIEPLFKGDHPFIETPREPDIERAFTEPFRQKFHPSGAMSKALGGLSNASVFSLSDSNLHMMQTIEGTEICATFSFFWMPEGGESQPLPNLPRKGTSDGANSICEGVLDNGTLARVAGVDAFVETMGSFDSPNSELRVVPLQQGKWGPACAVEADFGTEYSVSQAFVPDDGPFTQVQIRDVAAKIIEQHADAKDPKSFSFGPPAPASEEDNIQTMKALAAKDQDNWNHSISFPAFGGWGLLDDYYQSALGLIENYPATLDGKTYLVAIGRGVIGWRESAGSSGLVLYTLADGKLQPVGSAIVRQARGALTSVHATPWIFK